MDSPAKRPRLNERILIRLCDKFTRTEVDVICPLIKAENSIRVLYKVQKKLLNRALDSSGVQAKVNFKHAHWKCPPGGQENEGNLFIEYASQPHNESSVQILKEELKLRLCEILKGNYILVEQVQDMEEIALQPLISEFDFELHKLKKCFEELHREAEHRADFFVVEESINDELEEVKESYTKFAVLSQNGKGKSFIMNLLFLMTSDNQEEYSKNNSAVHLPQDFPNNVSWNQLMKSDVTTLPDVMKDFIKNKKDDFRKPVCYLLQNDTDTEASLESFKKLDSYFSEKSRLDLDPYVLSQKEESGSFETTTKCIIHLRYGVRYQMQVEYFNEEELKLQFFQLFITNEENANEQNVNEVVKERAEDCLKARYQILTGREFSEENSFDSFTDIELSEEALSFVGTTELYIGKGENPTQDRLALQRVLKALTASQEEDENKADESKRKIAAVKQIVVYLPSKILHGGKELLEMPGTDESDPIAMDFITKALRNVDAVILVTESGFKICEKEVKEMLIDSRFMQKFEKYPSGNKLMLLTYPEKNLKFQFSRVDKERIKVLEKESKKNREVELKTIGKMLKKSGDHESSIFTTYLLPVLHSSILSQKDPESELKVVAEYSEFLRYTGVQDFFIQLDKWVFTRQKFIFDEARKKLEHFQKILNGIMTPETSKSILKLFDKEFEQRLREKHRKLDKDLNSSIQTLLESEGKMVERAFKKKLPDAVQRWNAEKGKITSIGVYNPYFCGNNPIYKVRLFPIFFDCFEDQKEKIFNQLLSDIGKIYDKYKSIVVNLYHGEFDALLQGMSPPIPSNFVKTVVESKLEDARQWYMGKKRCPFNTKNLEKLMEKSQKQSLKTIILQKNFKKKFPEDLDKVKKETAADMEACFIKATEIFIQQLKGVKGLHSQRFKSLQSQLWFPRNGVSKIWKQLEQEVKSLSKDRDMEHLREVIGKLLTMMSATLNTDVVLLD
ncbi:uncharacterized protein [Hyperolius riggenbachi]|uniref:uncharacterized protein n=1 Tax=Hyperolius riggenbachi TaxID=752182 RepID=UPI0035A3A8C0